VTRPTRIFFDRERRGQKRGGKKNPNQEMAEGEFVYAQTRTSRWETLGVNYLCGLVTIGEGREERVRRFDGTTLEKTVRQLDGQGSPRGNTAKHSKERSYLLSTGRIAEKTGHKIGDLLSRTYQQGEARLKERN